jgi:Ca-activated chloride channel family protein
MTAPIALIPDSETLSPGAAEPGFGALVANGMNLPLRALDVAAQIVGLTARTRITQTFVNPLTEPLEAVYVFPLPDRAAVTAFQMTVGDRKIDGQLMERGKAQEAYDEALDTGHQAALAEEDRPGVFTMQVGNLMPGDTATVELEMVGPLSYAAGEATFRFPLVVAPRYIPGSALQGDPAGDGTSLDTDQTPDASRITPPVLLPGLPNPVRLSLSVDLDPAGLPITAVRSSLHAVSGTIEGGGRRTITVQPGERLNRDFILRLAIADEEIGTSLVFTPDADGKAGTFALILVPPERPQSAHRDRDIVFVLDRSGSMEGWKMVAARNTIASMVDTLSEGDRFTVMAFDDRIESPKAFDRNLARATDHHRHLALEFLATVEARGGTEMDRPLDEAVTQLVTREASRDQILVLVTDGQVGNEDQLLKRIGSRVGRIRIFTVGIDTAVNEGFLNRLAAVGRGACELVESEARLLEAMDSIHRQIATPILTDLRFLPDGLAIQPESIVPGRMPDLFADTPLTIFGRYTGQAAGHLQLEAKKADGGTMSATIPATVCHESPVASMWARGRVRELEDRYAIGMADRKALEQEITQTSLQFGVLCRFTAFVAIDASRIVNAGGQRHRVMQAVEAPQGWAMFKSQAAPDMIAMASLSCELGDMAPPSPRSPKAFSRKMGRVDFMPPSAPAPAPLPTAKQLAQSILDSLTKKVPSTAIEKLQRLSDDVEALEELLETIQHDGTRQALVEQLDSLLLAIDGAVPERAEELWEETLTILETLTSVRRAPSKRKSYWK